MGNEFTGEPTRILSEFASNLRYEDISPDILEKAKFYILDSLGCSIGGYLTEAGKIVVGYFESMGGNPESQVLATGHKMPCLNAVYVNAYLSNALDFDDTFGPWSHPGGMIIPPAMSVAEKLGRISGKDYLTAVVAGYEISLRVGLAIAPSPERFKQAWGISTHQVFGSATVAGKLLHLSPRAMATAYGFAGNSAPVPYCRKIGVEREERPFSWLKNNFGWAAMGGVLGAFLTEKGFVGPLKVLDGRMGFWAMSGSDQCDFEAMVKDLGKTFLMGETSFKPYASCRWTHSTIDAVREIQKKESIKPEMVERVTVYSFFEVSQNMNVKRPSNTFDAQFSIPYLIAVTLTGHSPHMGLYDEDLRDAKVFAIADKVRLEPDAEADYLYLNKRLMPSKVIIRMKDGREFMSQVDVPSGSPGKFQPLSEQIEKYKLLVSRVLGEQKATQTMGRILEMEKLPDVALVF